MSRAMPDPAFTVCVYCGSREGVAPPFVEAAQHVGRWIGAHGGQLVYGGGNSGLMGTVARSTLEAGGRVVGVIPQALVDKELAKQDCTELHVVETMHARKQMMAERADVFLTLPGGIGTFEEFFEAWTWRQLGCHDKPLGLLDIGGFYAPMMEALRTSLRHGFMNEWQMGLVAVDDQPQRLLESLVQAAGLSPGSDLSRI